MEKKTTSSFLPSSLSHFPAVFQAAVSLTGGGLTSSSGGGLTSSTGNGTVLGGGQTTINNSQTTINNGAAVANSQSQSQSQSQNSSNMNNLRKVGKSVRARKSEVNELAMNTLALCINILH